MIKSFKHKGLRTYFEKGTTAGIQPRQAARIRLLLTALDAAEGTDDLGMPGLGLHPLKGDRKGEWAVTVQANWRLTFKFVTGGVELVNYEDYH